MPWAVRKFKDGWYVVKTTTGKKMNKKPYKLKSKALAYLRALRANANK